MKEVDKIKKGKSSPMKTEDGSDDYDLSANEDNELAGNNKE